MDELRICIADDRTSHDELERMRVIVNDRYERDEGMLWCVANRLRAPLPLESYYGGTTQNSLLVAIMGARVVGSLLLQRGNCEDAPVKTYMFGMLAVEHEGCGHAKALIARAEDVAREEGAQLMELCVWKPVEKVVPAKERLVAMYGHLGYAVVGVQPLATVNPGAAADAAAPVQVVRMRKALQQAQNAEGGL